MAAFNPLDYPSAFANPQLVSDGSAWVTHIPFAMTLIPMLRPRMLVELGTLYGDSYCAFCQSIVANETETRCFAIDTWQGDQHVNIAKQGSHILESLRAHHDPQYGRFSTLIQSTFDEALPRFEDGSIDLLHVDGSHQYEAVKHDYQTWERKLSDRAVVLFHDIIVEGSGFGVHQFWREIAPGKPFFEFAHGWGLGVLGVGKNLPQPFVDFLETAKASPEQVRSYFFAVGHRIEMYRIAKMMINGHAQVHQLLERWLNERGHGLKGLPDPLGQAGPFLNQITGELRQVLEMMKT